MTSYTFSTRTPYKFGLLNLSIIKFPLHKHGICSEEAIVEMTHQAEHNLWPYDNKHDKIRTI